MPERRYTGTPPVTVHPPGHRPVKFPTRGAVEVSADVAAALDATGEFAIPAKKKADQAPDQADQADTSEED